MLTHIAHIAMKILTFFDFSEDYITETVLNNLWDLKSQIMTVWCGFRTCQYKLYIIKYTYHSVTYTDEIAHEWSYQNIGRLF